ncbi:hypothetical protein LIER_10223 [Lithospermum erythrorhizon]|uniref:Uncharacterized protein n=1 Tax=Lithospermum erythrorhizon TaxID=34254 RepID=A0AAV3PIF5_LITER
MFRIVCKSINSLSKTPQPNKLFILKLQEFSTSPKNAKKPISENANQDSFTVQYLMNEFGFSLEKAVLASKDVSFQNSGNPDKVVSFLKNQDFSDTQIRKLISKRSCVLILKPEKTLLPKVEFFRSKGASSTDLAKIVASDASILLRSLKCCISPAFKFLRDIVGSDESVIHMLKRNSRVLSQIECLVKPNIAILRQAGVPHSNIVYLLKTAPLMFLHCSSKLKESIDEVRKMGMDPNYCSFNLALSCMTYTPRSKWNAKMEAYKRWGCSENQVLTSFKIFPWIMTISEKKINGVMSFCVNEVGWKPSEVVRRYNIFTLSLNKRIIPRWSVYQELVSKRLVNGEVKKGMFCIKEDLFLARYVNCYKDEAPLLLKLYTEKLEASK